MNEGRQIELQRIRAEQNALREQWTRLEARLSAIEAATPATQSGHSSPVQVPVPPLPPPRTAPISAAEAIAPANPPRESLEMRIGTTWLVRAGIVLLLTSLALAGNYLYKNVIPHLGPWSKVALLYLGAGALSIIGAWLERTRQARENPGFLNYARVILAGGLAAIYYVTYAAHYFPNLRVIHSPVAAAVLLLGWTAFMAWLADRRNSEILATFSILLAYYTSAINEIGTVTLWSNLALSAGAVYLLRKHLWRIFPFATLLATYGSYAFWHFAHLYPRHPAEYGVASLWVECGFIGIYWILFTGAALTPGEHALPAARRAGFVSLNNAGFFFLTAWLLADQYPFWRWACGFGITLLVIGEAASRMPQPLDRATASAYRCEGILLVTLAVITYFSGWHLALMLALETAVLAVASGGEDSQPLLAMSAVCGFMALVAAGAGLGAEGDHLPDFPWSAGASVGGFLLFAGWWRQPFLERAGGRSGLAGAAPDFFCLLAAVTWFCLIESKVAYLTALIPFLAAAALALLALAPLLRLPALGWCAPIYLLAAQVHWLVAYRLTKPEEFSAPLWVLSLLAATVLFGYLWKSWAERPRPDGGFSGKSYPLYVLILILGTWCGWRYFGIANAGGHAVAFPIAARWSLYAAGVFALGLFVHERIYRWLGLLILLATLGRITLLDLWQLGLLERALSFLSLGVVLLAVGFLYNRFSAKFRDIF